MAPEIVIEYKGYDRLYDRRIHETIKKHCTKPVRELGSGYYIPKALRDITFACTDLKGLRKARARISKWKNVTRVVIYVDA